MKRKIGYALGLYIVLFLIFLAVDQAIVGQGVKQASLIVLSTAIGFLIGRAYFSKTPGDAGGGFQLGALWLLVGVALDWIIAGLSLLSGDAATIAYLVGFYQTWFFGVSVLGMVCAVALAGHTTHGGALMRRPPTTPMVLKK